jgi:hypothetical protein
VAYGNLIISGFEVSAVFTSMLCHYGTRIFSAYFSQGIFHAIETRRFSGQEFCCTNGTHSKRVPRLCFMNQFEPFAATAESYGMFPYDVSGSYGMYTDLILWPFTVSLYAHRLQHHPFPDLSQSIFSLQALSCPTRSIFLKTMMRFNYFNIRFILQVSLIRSR